MYVQVAAKGGHQVSSSLFFESLVPERPSWLDRVARRPLVLLSPYRAGIIGMCHYTKLFPWVRGLNPGLTACVANMLVIELSPQCDLVLLSLF